MIQALHDLGAHDGFPVGAMTKHELSAILCRAGVEAGFWVIPEYEIPGEISRKIDIVWALRTRPIVTQLRTPATHLWTPVAAFEIEGHDVDLGKSVPKDAASLSAAAERGAVVLAILLFQVGPSGLPWHRKRSQAYHDRVKAKLEECQSPHKVQLELDQNVRDCLRGWLQIANIKKEGIASPATEADATRIVSSSDAV
ncbi:MAG TPA: hypothetical protein VKU82_12740 [Planctomycetaceae bacterium]|nr:hypothetical protein [Planctomycetaceae bacterium]